MKLVLRHTQNLNVPSKSFLFSLVVHTVLLGLIFFSYKTITSNSTKKQESKVCINLSCLTHLNQEDKKIVKKIVEKKAKEIKKKTKPKIIKKIATPKITSKVEQIVIVKEFKVEVKKEEIQKKPQAKITKEIKTIEKKTISNAVPKEKPLSPQKRYINENIDIIVQLLQENLYYPRRARKRGVEGEVIVRFRLLRDSSVNSIEVLSSQSDLLSRAAIRTIEDLSLKFPKPKEELLLSVPITYKLNK